MTGPYTDWTGQYGLGSPAYDKELAAFMAMRDAMMGARLQTATQFSTPTAFQGVTQPMTEAQPVQSLPDADLIGAMKHWGVPEEVSTQLPRKQLEEMLAEFRNKNRPPEDTFEQRLSATPKMLLALPVMAAIGASEAVTGGLQRLPLIGEALSHSKMLHDADLWLRDLEEGVRSQTPASFNTALSGANMVGNLGALFYPGTAAWAISGKVGRALPWVGKLVTSPLARSAAQGGASAALLMGRGLFNSEDPYHAQAMMDVALGGGLGAVGEGAVQLLRRYGPAIEAARGKVSSMIGMPDFMASKPAAARSVVAESATDIETLQRIMADPAASAESKQTAQAVLQALGERTATVQPTNARPVPPLNGPLAGFEDLPPDVQASIHQSMQEPYTPKPGITLDQVDGISSAMNKQDAAMDSPLLPQLAQQPAIDEVSIARAQVASNPGGTNIVEGVSDPSSFARVVLQSNQDMHVRFARRPGSFKLDALMSDQPLTDRMVSEYESHGLYTTQRTLLPSGIEGEITGIHGSMVSAKPLYGGAEQFFPVADLMPYTSTPTRLQDEGLWQAFNRYADIRTTEAGKAMGGALSEERLALMRQEYAPKYLSEFLDDTGVTAPGDRARLTQFFNERFVDGYKALAPAETAWAEGVKGRSAALVSENAHLETPTRRVDDMAAAKGYRAVPRGDGTFALVDALNDTQAPSEIHFNSREAGEEFLRRTMRTAPDITPGSAVPLEVAGGLPTSDMHEPSLRSDQFEKNVIDGVDDLAEAADDVPGWAEGARAQARAVAASGNWGRLEAVWNEAMGKWRPSRARFTRLQTDLKENGLDLDIFGDQDRVSVARDRRHNWQTPWHDRGTDVLNKFNLRQLTEGHVTEISGMKGVENRTAEASRRGFDATQIKAIEDYRQLYVDLQPELARSGHNPLQILEDYVPHVKQRQSLGFSGREAFGGPSLDPEFSFFADHARTGNLQFREMDARVLWNTYLNGLGFKLHMAAEWQPIIAKWNGIAKMTLEDGSTPLKPLADIFLNWADLVRYGYRPGNDAMLNAAHTVLNTLVPGVSKQEARMIFNHGLTMTHSALLGYRPDVWARDSIQLLLALPRAGSDLLEAMVGYARNPAQRREMWDKAMQHSFVQLGMPRIAAPGLFEGRGLPPSALAPETAATEALSMSAGGQQAPVSGRYKIAQQVHEAVYDALPSAGRALQDTPLHPLYIYTKQGERMRLFTGYAGYTRAAKALSTYRSAGEAASFDQLMGESAARTFDPAVQDKFKQLVAAGMDEEAAGFMGRQLADATQFRYGTTEIPEVARSTFGRMGMQMGNFSFQFYQYLMESVKNGTMADKAKFLTLMGAVTAGLHAATKATGWNFNKWQYWGSLTFTGGPWLQTLAKTTIGLQATGRALMGSDSQQVQNDMGYLGQAAGDVVSQINPLGGLVRDVRGVQGVRNSPDPLAALGRLVITGEIGPGPDWDRRLIDAVSPGSPYAGPGYRGVPSAPPSLSPSIPSSSPLGGAGSQPWNIQSPAVPQVPPPGQPAHSYAPGNAGGLEDANAASAGDPQARSRFAQDELGLLDAMRYVPPIVRWQALTNYRAKRAVGGQRTGPLPTQPAHPGAGTMF